MSNVTKEEVEQDIALYSSLESVASSEGGKHIIKNLKTDINGAISNIVSNYKKAPHIELIGYCAVLSERISLLKTLTRASKNKDLAIETLKLFEDTQD